MSDDFNPNDLFRIKYHRLQESVNKKPIRFHLVRITFAILIALILFSSIVLIITGTILLSRDPVSLYSKWLLLTGVLLIGLFMVYGCVKSNL